MNTFVADPEWGWWIILYFFFGGIAAGAYFVSTLIELAGSAEDRKLARVGYLLAFPMIAVCAVFLILDLNQPTRFWHMLFKSEVVDQAMRDGWPLSGEGWQTMAGAPLVKYWSPMSIGSWAISLFGLCSLVSFIAALWSGGPVARLHGSRWFGHPLRVIGCAVGFFVASYTGALLTATNQPLWSDSVWIAPLFLTSAASTGIAAMILFGRGTAHATVERLEKADLWALALELLVFIVFLASLGPLLLPLLGTIGGKLLVLGVFACGLFVPLVIHLRLGLRSRKPAVTAAVFVLLGGLFLRYGLLSAPSELLSTEKPIQSPAASLTNFGPEAGRERGERGADPGNRDKRLQPRSKIFSE